MLSIPKHLSENVEKIIRWFLQAYGADKIEEIQADRILTRQWVNGSAQFEEKELHFLYDCVLEALKSPEQCGIEKVALKNIYDWVTQKRDLLCNGEK